MFLDLVLGLDRTRHVEDMRAIGLGVDIAQEIHVRKVVVVDVHAVAIHLHRSESAKSHVRESQPPQLPAATVSSEH